MQTQQDAAVSLFCQQCNNNINSTLSNFWQSKAVPEKFTEHLSSEQQYCEQYFKNTVTLVDNKFLVSMALKVDNVNDT